MKRCEACGGRGHTFDKEGQPQVCECLRQRRLRRRLGRLYSPSPKAKTALSRDHLEENVYVHGSLPWCQSHLHRAALDMIREKVAWRDLSLQRVMDIWLDREAGTEDGLLTLGPILRGCDLLVFFIGWEEMINKEKPAGILKVLDACALDQIPVWVVSAFPLGQLATKYNEAVSLRLESFARVHEGGA